MKLRIIDHTVNPAPLNMAIDELLFREYSEHGTPVFRFYSWELPSLSMGYFQNSSSFKELWDRKDISVVRRLTGGRAVLHHLELTYCIIAGHDDIFRKRSLYETYYFIAEIFKAAFSNLGIDLCIVKENKRENSSNCFESPSLYEITINDFKVIGSAQYRENNKFLQHGSIILEIDYALWSDTYKIDSDVLKKKMKGINNIGNTALSIMDIQIEMIRSLNSIFECSHTPLSEGEMERANELSLQRYSSFDWTFRK